MKFLKITISSNKKLSLGSHSIITAMQSLLKQEQLWLLVLMGCFKIPNMLNRCLNSLTLDLLQCNTRVCLLSNIQEDHQFNPVCHHNQVCISSILKVYNLVSHLFNNPRATSNSHKVRPNLSFNQHLFLLCKQYSHKLKCK